MGEEQEEWIEKGLKDSQERGTVWKMVLNQVILGTSVLRARVPDHAETQCTDETVSTIDGPRRLLTRPPSSSTTTVSLI